MNINLQQLPQISIDYITQIKRLFNLFEIKSSGLASLDQLINDMPYGVPGLPSRIFYLLNELTKSKKGLFSFQELLFSIRLLMLKNLEHESIEKIVEKITSNSDILQLKKQIQFVDNAPKTLPRRPHRSSHTNLSSTSITNNEISDFESNIPEKRFTRSKSLHDMKMENFQQSQIFSWSASPKNMAEQSDSNVKITELVEENKCLYRDIRCLKKELDYYRDLFIQNQKEQVKSSKVEHSLLTPSYFLELKSIFRENFKNNNNNSGRVISRF